MAAVISTVIIVAVPFGIFKHFFKFLAKKSRRIQISPEIFFLVSGWLKAGLTLEEVWELLIKESPPDFRELTRLDAGGEAGWLSIQQRFQILFQDEKWALARAVLQMGHESGGELAKALTQCALIYQRKTELEKRIGVLTSEGKLSAWVVGLVPFGFLGLLYFVAPDMVRPLFFSKAGRVLLVAAMLLSSAGIYLVHKVAGVKV